MQRYRWHVKLTLRDGAARVASVPGGSKKEACLSALRVAELRGWDAVSAEATLDGPC